MAFKIYFKETFSEYTVYSQHVLDPKKRYNN